MTQLLYIVTLFGLKIEIDPIAFTLPIKGGWDVYWYGILIAIGFLLAIVYCFWRAKKYGVDLDRLTDVVLVTTPLAILCARIYYIIFYPGDLDIKNIWDFLGITDSSGVAGLAIYGGVIGAAVIGFLMCKIRKVNVLDAFDLAACGFLIGQGIGRWGNFFNQEAFGSATGSSWFGMTSEPVAKELGEGVLAHPCFLYESIWCILGFVLLHFIGNRRKFSGQLALTYGAWYGVGRMIIEGFRTDSLLIGYHMRVSQWLSGALALVCIILLIVMFRRLRRAKIDQTYTAMFDDIEDFTVTTVSISANEETEGSEISDNADTNAPDESVAEDSDSKAETEIPEEAQEEANSNEPKM